MERLRNESIFDKFGYFLMELPQVVKDAAKIIGILLAAFIIVRLGRYLIKRFFVRKSIFKSSIDEKKFNTMTSLMVSIFRYVVYIIAIVTILTDVLDMTSVLAAAGVGGVAIGFGAQSLIKDVISGFFIVMEDQYAVGDLVTIEGMNGTVEEMELRVTKLRNFSGDLYIIPNGEIKKVINHTRGNKAVLVDIPVAYSADTGRAFSAAQKVCEKVADEFDTIVEEPKVLGITDMDRDGFVIRIFAKTLPNEQWVVERRVRRLIKEGFDDLGIEFFDRDRVITREKSLGGDRVNG